MYSSEKMEVKNYCCGCCCCCCCGARLKAKLLWQTLEISLGRGRGCPSLHRLFQSAAVFPWWLLGTSTSALLFLAPHCIFCTLVTPFRQSCWHSELVACNALIVIGRVSKHPFCCLLSCPSSLTLLCRTLLLLDVGVLDLQTCAVVLLWYWTTVENTDHPAEIIDNYLLPACSENCWRKLL